ncbi:MAG: TrmH family RNA methyltransferase [bacterium]|nr:TrmH family RNA methyltransferase [bacterium]
MIKIKMIIILHNIRSLHNVGSIFRTADAAGIEKIYLCGITPAPIDQFGKYRPQLTKVSLGAEKYVAWEKIDSTTKLIDKLKGDGYKIFSIEQSKKSIPYSSVLIKTKGTITRDSAPKIALVLGNEIKGLPASILKRSDKILEIPMKGKKESLNVAVAFGIVVFSLEYKAKK